MPRKLFLHTRLCTMFLMNRLLYAHQKKGREGESCYKVEHLFFMNTSVEGSPGPFRFLHSYEATQLSSRFPLAEKEANLIECIRSTEWNIFHFPCLFLFFESPHDITTLDCRTPDCISSFPIPNLNLRTRENGAKLQLIIVRLIVLQQPVATNVPHFTVTMHGDHCTLVIQALCPCLAG